jgi:hypothetical protein
MKKYYSRKRKARASRRKAKTMRQRRQRRRSQRRNGGAMPPVQNYDALQRHFNVMGISIMDSINGTTGRWVRDFYLPEQNTCKFIISADMNNNNQDAINYFMEDLEAFLQEKIQEINADLSSRGIPAIITNLQVSDISIDEARTMTQNPHVQLDNEVEEIFGDWDTGIHKLIIVSANYIQ